DREASAFRRLTLRDQLFNVGDQIRVNTDADRFASSDLVQRATNRRVDGLSRLQLESASSQQVCCRNCKLGGLAREPLLNFRQTFAECLHRCLECVDCSQDGDLALTARLLETLLERFSPSVDER